MRVRPGVVAALLVTSLSLAACGGGSSDETTGSADGGSSGAKDVASLQKVIDQYTAEPTFTAPGPAIDPAKVKGKTVFNIPDSSGNPFATAVAKSEEAAAKLLGINFINCTNQGQVTQWVTCYNQAIQRKVDVINDFGGADPRQLGPQIAAAQKAGIEVVGHNVYGFSQKPVGLKYSVPTPYEKAGELMGTWVALDTKRDANALVITSNEVLATKPIVDNIKAVFDKECPGCKLTMVNVPVKDWSTKIQSEVQSAMVRDPKLNYVVPIYDSMTQFVVPAITTAAKTDKVHVATFNGTPFVLKYMQEGDIVRMVVGESLDWIGYAFMDTDARLLAGLGLPEIFDAKIPLRIFTKDNVDEAGSPPAVSTGYGDSYISGYKQLWGLS
ncbi:MAG: ribose transport system substrate-binding protein [Pseudonocardiales bacterium]|nr:ribose transport system substrate-binding protein [Pseudonocardiales bacterium]